MARRGHIDALDLGTGVGKLVTIELTSNGRKTDALDVRRQPVEAGSLRLSATAARYRVGLRTPYYFCALLAGTEVIKAVKDVP